MIKLLFLMLLLLMVLPLFFIFGQIASGLVGRSRFVLSVAELLLLSFVGWFFEIADETAGLSIIIAGPVDSGPSPSLT